MKRNFSKSFFSFQLLEDTRQRDGDKSTGNLPALSGATHQSTESRSRSRRAKRCGTLTHLKATEITKSHPHLYLHSSLFLTGPCLTSPSSSPLLILRGGLCSLQPQRPHSKVLMELDKTPLLFLHYFAKQEFNRSL